MAILPIAPATALGVFEAAARENRSMQTKRSNPWAWWAFWIGLLGLVLMPIPLFIGLILGGGLAAIAAILAIIALFKSRHAGGRGIAPAVIAGVFVLLTYGGISLGGGIYW